ncbi:ArsR/SmtB family transcription factor [Pectobacterium versatile]|uniref:ArsR/SmtB family transcription factor n=1 Tax=Pectobacterium versatile TaxID=2488639 RepID=UPI000D60E899|nr:MULTISPECIES: metalloregulator ArsR/SmtB family transcription factor [Pectobacterium]MBA0170143.1 helix-turn-helix transcriptional regulator [Pectobacterium versatile]MBN3236667.1 helix-turn-helix transcriptional regulator [Pectobacterium versatile]MCL6333499.1 transcriptional regulator [Pectobacterium carotovorum subsp. carotovorum]MCL6345281.1 transcriptional regulator [Pectobacterium carotovorum subsp. carotovorum]MCL6400958.1 transcriptional regulator [Pectobacterium carotovorum subsp. 
MNKQATTTAELLRALGNEQRLIILEWLADPRAHFPEQQDGDLVKDGVCVGFITEKIGLSQPTVTGHLQYLSKAGIVTSKRIKNWVFYKLVPERLDEATTALSELAKLASRQHQPSE